MQDVNFHFLQILSFDLTDYIMTLYELTMNDIKEIRGILDRSISHHLMHCGFLR